MQPIKADKTPVEGSPERTIFYGTFEKYGIRKNKYATGNISTMLFVNVTDEKGTAVCAETWIIETGQFKEFYPVEIGQRVRFEARARTNAEGVFEITYPTKVALISEGQEAGEMENINQLDLPL